MRISFSWENYKVCWTEIHFIFLVFYQSKLAFSQPVEMLRRNTVILSHLFSEYLFTISKSWVEKINYNMSGLAFNTWVGQYG